MPYKSLDDANPALKGIKPKVTLEQANLIAGWADSIAKGDNPPDSPWAVAIANFKKAYIARGGKWVKKDSKKEGEPVEPVDDAAPEDDDTEEPLDGEERYKPRKHEKSLCELKRLRKEVSQLLKEVSAVRIREEGDPTGGGNEGEWEDEDYEMPAPLKGVKSFKDMEAKQKDNDGQEEMKKAIHAWPQLAFEIMRGEEDDAAKLEALQALCDEFMQKAGEALKAGDSADGSDVTADGEEPPADGEEPVTDGTAGEKAKGSRAAAGRLAESYTGTQAHVVILEEGLPLSEFDKPRPLTMTVELIQPGWGNTQDNHYYPAEMLKTCAEKFVGAKMYESEHDPTSKSTRTWVSTVKSIKGFSEAGAPVAEVVVHDPGFAERARNLKAADLLEKMECSILADGRATPGFREGDREGKKVEEITSVESVDWVTRAGAGGHAADLSEKDKRGGTTVNISQAVKEQLIEASRLPKVAKDKLRVAEYSTEAALSTAIDAERTYLKEAVGSGEPFGNPPTSSGGVAISEADRAKAQDAVIKQYFN